MTSRLPGFSRSSGVRSEGDVVSDTKLRPGMFKPVPVSEKMVDEAVQTVVTRQGLSPEVANVLMFNLGKDTSGSVAHAYYTSQNVLRTSTMGISRGEIVVKYVLDEDQVSALVDYAPEYKLTFRNKESHDHPMAAATRMIDHKLIASRLPRNVKYTDVGGNPLVYIRGANSAVHVCGTTLDKKDLMRHKLRFMEARQLAQSHDQQVAALATSYLESDSEFVCGKQAQKCNHASKVLISVHVYDIPLRDWPKIMSSKGAELLEGCMIFSPKFFESTSGEVGVSGARYAIDVHEDRFAMGFSGSPAWWYTHKWSEFMLYGADQTLEANGRVYSYKITERRGDTIFFRILEMSKRIAPPPTMIALRTPSVPLVEVRGFELDDVESWSRPNLRRKVYRFPRNLWYEMVSQASEDFEKGVLDYLRMYNHYRTVSVRQTINAVLVMGGDPVSNEELVPLVVHSCLAAAAQSLLGQKVSKYLTSSEQRYRTMKTEGVATKLVQTFRALASATISKIPPLRALEGFFSSITEEMCEQWILDWEPEPKDIVVPVNALSVGKVKGRGKVSSVSQMYTEAAAANAVFDHMAAVVSDDHLRSVFSGLCPHVEVPEPESIAGDSVQTLVGTNVTDGTDEHLLRINSIHEHIVEIQAQNRATAALCDRAYTELCAQGVPRAAALKSRFELYRSPDLWEVINGVVVKSALGIPIADFKFSAVYYPVPDPDTGERIRSVYCQRWEGVDSQGQKVANDNWVLADKTLTGYVLTTDDLVIFNGPEILASLESATLLEHTYKVVLHRAPPGSGKTYSIVHSVVPDGSDVIQCPVRESIQDTRAQVDALHPDFPDSILRVRTVDSYLVNLHVKPKTKELRAKRMLADECFMAHSAKWYAAAALLEVEELHAYGDDKQIPHIPRVQAPKLHVKIRPQVVHENWLVRRCPASALAAWGSVYEWKVRTNSTVNTAMKEVRDTGGAEIPRGCVMMCMYQADKATLRKKYAQRLSDVKVLTTHEAEGKTYKHVWLHRFDTRKRSDKTSLFDQEPHVLVAMSRHTHEFKYVCPADVGDLVSQWIKRSSNPRRIASMADVSTAGTPREFL